MADMFADIAIAIYSSCDTWDSAPTVIHPTFQPTIAASTLSASQAARAVGAICDRSLELRPWRL